MQYDNTYVLVDLDRITENFRAICQKAGVPVMAVVKADAYGHGAVPVAKALQADCEFFGVATILEALELRRSGIQKPILVLGNMPAEAYPEAIRLGVRPTLYDPHEIRQLAQAAAQVGMEAKYHLAVDTGMNRIGVVPTEATAVSLRDMADLPNVVMEGVFTHFATADSADLSQAKQQVKLFDDFLVSLERCGIRPKYRHIDNSAGIMNFENHYDMVRSGIITYGLYPSDQVDPDLLPIQPAMSWHSRVIHLKDVQAGQGISYGATFVTDKLTRVATIPVGYADGYCRNLSNRFYVLIKGKKAPILGRICMDQMMVDVTDIEGVQLGEPVVLIGTDGDETITMEQIAETAYSFQYEFPCGIGRRVPRLYRRAGKIDSEVHYLQ